MIINLAVDSSHGEIGSLNRDLVLHNQIDDETSSQRQQQYINLVTKNAEWDHETKAYYLEFEGRAEEPSINNLQIVDGSSKQNVVLQLGKMNSKCFCLDYKYPFNAFTAFGLAVSCLSRN